MEWTGQDEIRWNKDGIDNRVYLSSLFLWFFLFLIFLGEEGREEKRRKGRETFQHKMHPSDP